GEGITEVGCVVAEAVSVGAADGVTVERESSAVTCRMRVANVGVLLGVSVAVGVLVAVAVTVNVVVGVSVAVGVLVAVSVGRTASVGSSAVESLPLLKARKAVPVPISTRANSPNNHFFTRITPVSALAHLPHGTETGVETGVILHRWVHQF